LRGAHVLARRFGATLRAIAVLKERASHGLETEAMVSGQMGKDLEDVVGEHLAELRGRLERAIAALDGVDVPIEIDVAAGDPARIIVDTSRHLDLLVCGSRGYGPLPAVLLGSVSRRVASGAHCPVIVLPRGVTASLEGLMGGRAGMAFASATAAGWSPSIA
jgi:nucleotide-binding universal stress UspA family protein